MSYNWYTKNFIYFKYTILWILTYILLWNHHCSQDNKHINHLKKIKKIFFFLNFDYVLSLPFICHYFCYETDFNSIDISPTHDESLFSVAFKIFTFSFQQCAYKFLGIIFVLILSGVYQTSWTWRLMIFIKFRKFFCQILLCFFFSSSLLLSLQIFLFICYFLKVLWGSVYFFFNLQNIFFYIGLHISS